MSSARAILDANIFVCHLVADDADLHAQANVILADIQSGKRSAIPREPALAETFFVLKSVYGVTKPQAISHIMPIFDSQGLVGDDIECMKDALALFRKNNISIVDACLAAYARKTGADLITFDKKLAKVAARVSKEER